MTELLSAAFQTAETLDAAEQDKIADAVLTLLKAKTDAPGTDEIDPAHLRAIELAIG